MIQERICFQLERMQEAKQLSKKAFNFMCDVVKLVLKEQENWIAKDHIKTGFIELCDPCHAADVLSLC